VVVGGAANAAAASYRAGGDLYYRSGSSAAGVGQLRGIGAFLGKDAGAASDALAGALHNGSYGAAILNSRGIVDMGSFTKDRGANYIRAIKELVKMPEAQAIRVARDTGLQDELWLRDLSPESRKRVMDSYGESGSPAERRAEAEYRGSKEILGSKWDRFARQIGAPAVAIATGAIDFVSQVLDPGAAAREAGRRMSGRKEAKDPVGDNTDAIQDLTRTLKGGRDQVGGGSRSMGAVPAGWKLMTMDSALKGQAMAMGAFGV